MVELLPSLLRREAWERDQQARLMALHIGKLVYEALGGEQSPETAPQQGQQPNDTAAASGRFLPGPPERLVEGMRFRTASGRTARVVSADALIQAMSTP